MNGRERENGNGRKLEQYFLWLFQLKATVISTSFICRWSSLSSSFHCSSSCAALRTLLRSRFASYFCICASYDVCGQPRTHKNWAIAFGDAETWDTEHEHTPTSNYSTHIHTDGSTLWCRSVDVRKLFRNSKPSFNFVLYKVDILVVVVVDWLCVCVCEVFKIFSFTVESKSITVECNKCLVFAKIYAKVELANIVYSRKLDQKRTHCEHI